MSTQPEQEKAQAEKPGNKWAWVPPRLETLPLRDALAGHSHFYQFDSATMYHS